jgi:hypothetical protein
VKYLLFTWDAEELPDYTPGDHLVGVYETVSAARDALEADDRDCYQCVDQFGRDVELYAEPAEEAA